MAIILFAHELGLGFGHLNRLLSIAGHFGTHDLVFGGPDPRPAAPIIRAKLGPSVEVMTVGEWRYVPPTQPPLPPGSPWTLADMLYDFGFGDRDVVERGVATWAARLDAIRPDLIVADFAPMLRIGTAGRIPTVMVGNGFTVPPPVAPLPGLRSDRRTPSAASRAREAAILSNANAARGRLGLADVRRAADLFQGDDTFATTFDIFDPYCELRQEPPLPPFNIPDLPVGPTHGERTGPHVFCYLDPGYRGLDPLLTALNGLARPSQLYIRNLDPREIVRHCAPQVGVHQGQADFRSILPQTRLLIHHATLGTAAAGVLAGVPQLLLPFTYEQEITASAVVALDCAVSLIVEAAADPAVLRQTIEALLTSRQAQTAALAQAQRLQAKRRPERERAIVEACRRRLH